KSYGHYKGLYVHGDRVMLSYRIGDCDVLDVPDYGEFDGRPMFSRTLRLAATKSPHVLVLFQDPAGEPARVMAGIVDPTSTVTLAVDGPRNLLRVAPFDHERTVRVFIAPPAGEKVPRDLRPAFKGDPFELVGGGPARYPKPVQTRGRLGTG